MASTQESPQPTDVARDHVEFLVSSWNRLDVLQTVADEPRTRDALREDIPVSRVTLSRILSDLESRGWVTRGDDGYRATSAGTFVADELTQLLDNVRTLDRLEDNVEWMRVDQFDFELTCLQDAEVIMPSWDDFSAQTRTLRDQVAKSTGLKGIGTGLDREFMQAVAAQTLEGDLSVDMIFTSDVIAAIDEIPDLARRCRELTAAPNADIYRYRGDDALMELGIHETDAPEDGVVRLCGEYEDGAPPGTIESTDPSVLQWAESYFTARRAESDRLESAVFTP